MADRMKWMCRREEDKDRSWSRGVACITNSEGHSTLLPQLLTQEEVIAYYSQCDEIEVWAIGKEIFVYEKTEQYVVVTRPLDETLVNKRFWGYDPAVDKIITLTPATKPISIMMEKNYFYKTWEKP